MRKVYTIQHGEFNQKEWIFSVQEKIDLHNIQPSGQVLTDSDNCAFVYIIIENNEYSYIRFPKTVWPSLLNIVQNKGKVFLQDEHEKKELIHFAEELEMLLWNIEGNGNYGEIFVETVENIFKPFFKGDNR